MAEGCCNALFKGDFGSRWCSANCKVNSFDAIQCDKRPHQAAIFLGIMLRVIAVLVLPMWLWLIEWSMV
eukprot:11715932-Ditylum_brightwellii.AAC.1